MVSGSGSYQGVSGQPVGCFTLGTLARQQIRDLYPEEKIRSRPWLMRYQNGLAYLGLLIWAWVMTSYAIFLLMRP